MRCRNAYLAFNAREYSFFLVPYLETLAAASKKAIGLTTTLHVHRAFWNISLPPPHDYGVKVPTFTFVEGKNRRQRLFFFFSWTSIQSLKFNSEKVADTWRTERRRHCCLRSQFFGRARERGVQFRYVVYKVWLVSYLFFSFQIWYLRKWISTSVGEIEAPSTRIRIFLNPDFFSLRIRLPSTRIRWIRHTNP